MNDSLKISQRLLEVRKRFNLTQTELAIELGVSLSYIHQLESEKKTDPSGQFVRLLDLWEQVHAPRERGTGGQPIEPSAIPMKIEERPVVGYRVGASPPCPLHDEPLMQRLRTIANQSGLSEETLITAALTQFVEQCETSGKVSVSLKLPTLAPALHPPPKQAEQPGGGDDRKKDKPSAALIANAACVVCDVVKS